ncbi:MAG TPA: TlpA disulfide reductase family protein [Vicinamibacterales bacterium]
MRIQAALIVVVAASVTSLQMATGLSAAPTPAEAQLARGRALWDQRLSKSAIAALEIAAKDRATAAEADEVLGRIYTFKGWQQEGTFQAWHDEPGYRTKALAVLRTSVAAAPGRASALEALKTAERFAAADKVDAAPPSAWVTEADAAIEAARTSKASIAAIEETLDRRAKAQADPAPYFTGAQILIDRGAYEKAVSWAERGAKASDHFVDENLGAYQMSGKIQTSYARGRATSADLAGWALLLKKDLPAAAAKLQESERLSQGFDFNNQFHLAELARAQDDTTGARNHYLDALSLAGGAAATREKAMKELTALQPSGTGNEPFNAWLETELARRRDERKTAALSSLVDRPLPKLALRTVDGKPYDLAALRGKIVLLDFFASWCGTCRQELPHLKTSYAKYQHDPTVVFLLVSIDEDAKRLDRYLDEMKFPFPVARLDIGQAERSMGFDNVPSTYYLDRNGIVRYQIVGAESHGDSPARVNWFIDQLKGDRASQQ